ncbi:hypothetical protein O181_096669 [Austropuccinia psidii MF-1]|uniref:Reverse transcriptase/retrotransposon-derived protein RNase H-like domain-containing protein n=1 Tax=Austropuccinia psidii MF-1 TaxID=1389203 RepID=A0A9Q3PCW3_9BASI|nr:hypothetical protein [Austropuccinia psidii MF-1]
MVISKFEEEHVTHVSTALSRLRANNLFAKASKCLLHASSVEYLVHVVSSEGLKMDQEKESFRKFHQLKEALTTAPIFSHFNPSLTTIVETDASDYALGAVLSQVSDSGKHPIAFDSHKPNPEDINYEIHDKELLGIFWALKHWRAFLLSLSSPFEVLTNHSYLKYFISSKILTLRQAYWAEFLSEFHFSITYLPGSLDTLPDALLCQDDVYQERGEDFISKNPINFQQPIQKDEVQPLRFAEVKV